MALPSDPQEAQEDVAYIEAEIAALKEELEVSNVLQRRKEFVLLRITRLEKEIPRIREKARRAQHLEWLLLGK